MPYRSRKETLKYRKRLKALDDEVCEFCKLSKKDKHFVKELTHFIVVKNIHPYSIWDEREVVDHLLLIPKVHTDTLADLSAKALVEYAKIVTDYEAGGYDIFARNAENSMKSVVHQHTHLIKTNGKLRRVLIFLRKPYFRITI